MPKNEICTCTTLRRSAQALTELYDRILAPSGLKITQLVILRDLMYRPDIEKSITALAQEEGLDRTTMGKNLRVLEREQLVAFAVGDDRRERIVQITPRGRQTLESALPLWEQAQERMVQSLGQEQLDNLRALLAKVEEAGVSTP